MRYWMPSGCLALFFLLAFLLFPFFLADVIYTALSKLGLDPSLAILLVIGIFFGGLINLPVRRIERGETVEVVPISLFGLNRLFSIPVRRRQYSVIAVNLGGAVIPGLLALYELTRIYNQGARAWTAAVIAVAVNVGASYALSRPVRGVGIALNPLVPGLLAAASALLLMPTFAPPIAFVAGVFGPLIGADLLHLNEISKMHTGVMSIGGAGTFDGIVLSGLVATLLS